MVWVLELLHLLPWHVPLLVVLQQHITRKTLKTIALFTFKLISNFEIPKKAGGDTGFFISFFIVQRRYCGEGCNLAE